VALSIPDVVEQRLDEAADGEQHVAVEAERMLKELDRRGGTGRRRVAACFNDRAHVDSDLCCILHRSKVVFFATRCVVQC
jgi:hypothetical protein